MEIKLKGRSEILVEDAHKILGMMDTVTKILDDVDVVISRTTLLSESTERMEVLKEKLSDLKNNNLITAICALNIANKIKDD